MIVVNHEYAYHVALDTLIFEEKQRGFMDRLWSAWKVLRGSAVALRVLS